MTAAIAATVAIAVSKLEIDPANVRKSFDTMALNDLAANIEANGLLQNLVVRPAEKKGHFYVTAGGRRLRALQILIAEKRLPKNHEVQCAVREGEALEISLSENMMREAMHPLDQFDAFSALAAEGKSLSDIAVRYGTTEVIVKRRLALSKVNPALRELFRENEIGLEQLSAFTVIDDHEEQLRVWNSLPNYNRHASTIKAALAGEGVRSTDKRVQFIGGLDAYQEAGGTIIRDLFDDKGGGYATDIALLEKLVAEKMEAEAEKVKAEGWAWVEVLPEWDWNYAQGFNRVYPQPVALNEAEQAELDGLTARLEALEQIIESGEDDGGAEVEAQEIEAKIKLLQREVYEEGAIEVNGAFLTMTHIGELRIERGFSKKQAKEKVATGSEQDENEPTGIVYTAALNEDLTAQKTAALRYELANNHSTALAAVVHAMLLNVAFRGYGHTNYSCLELRLTHTSLEGSVKAVEKSVALMKLEALAEDMGRSLPANPANLWDWCQDLKETQLLALLAYAASHSVNAVVGKSSFRDPKQLAHADALGVALGTDMRNYFSPTAESYFDHMNRTSIQAAVAEAKGDEFAKGIADMKKKDAAAYAEKAVKGSNWLPAPLLFSQPDSEIEAELSIEDAEEDYFDEAEEVEASAEIIQFSEAAE